MKNSIVDDGCDADIVMTSLGGNIDASGGTCLLYDPTDQDVADALLGPLQDNGGATQTLAPLPGSPALDVIAAASCIDADSAPLLVDQIGTSRPQGTNCDVGAVEVSSLCAGVDCEDGETCTANACDPGTGICSQTPLSDNARCNDGLGICYNAVCWAL